MQENLYRKLARRLDATPNGFPATESGVELRLLAKIFAPEEAALASVMRQTPESAAEISARAGVDPDTALSALQGMATKGLISSRKSEGHPVFGLRPFIVGLYEAQLPAWMKKWLHCSSSTARRRRGVSSATCLPSTASFLLER